MLCVSTGNDFDPEESAAYQAIMSKCLSNVIASGEKNWKWNNNSFPFGDADAATIVKGLEGNTTVTELDLAYKYFTEAGLQEIAKMMENNSTITSVDLNSKSPFRLGAYLPGLRRIRASLSAMHAFTLAVVDG